MHKLSLSNPWLALSLAFTGAICASCRQTPEPVVRDELQEMTATVEAVYLPTRMVVLRDDHGGEAAVVVGPEVQNLEQVEVGDKVTVSYYQGIAAAVKKPGESAGSTEPEVAQSEVRAGPGQRPAGAIGQAVTATVTIESVDTSLDTVTFRRPDGIVRTVAIQSPEGRKFIHQLRRGDQVEVTYTEALAVAVRPAG
jgi:hypothetical protein